MPSAPMPPLPARPLPPLPPTPTEQADDAPGQDLATAVQQRKKPGKAPAAPGRTQILYEHENATRANDLQTLHLSAY